MTGNASSEVSYLLRRAQQEAIIAIVTDQTPGSPVHRELTRRYSMLAARALAEAAVLVPAR